MSRKSIDIVPDFGNDVCSMEEMVCQRTGIILTRFFDVVENRTKLKEGLKVMCYGRIVIFVISFVLTGYVSASDANRGIYQFR